MYWLPRNDSERVEVCVLGGQFVEASVEARPRIFVRQVQDERVGVGGGEGRDVLRAQARDEGAQRAVYKGRDSAC